MLQLKEVAKPTPGDNEVLVKVFVTTVTVGDTIMRSLIDYTQEAFTQSGETYDLIFDAVGKLSPSRGKKALKKTGIYLDVLKDSGRGEKKEELIWLKALVETGKLKPVIDRCYSFEQIPEAHRYVDKGHEKGNVVITVAHNSEA